MFGVRNTNQQLSSVRFNLTFLYKRNEINGRGRGTQPCLKFRKYRAELIVANPKPNSAVLPWYLETMSQYLMNVSSPKVDLQLPEMEDN
eukprot:snap_masked-scaffold_8-processed-gene-12.25-mRNA-1 protein AED:1.00 eAED:1.00 QI:0/0/0/0/1/1/2/0/88